MSSQSSSSKSANSKSANLKSIGIAGAGIIGRLIALELNRQGHKVTIFDQDPMVSDNLCDFLYPPHQPNRAISENSVPNLGTSACSYTAAGMLTPFSEAETAEPLVVELGIKSQQLWPALAKSLGAEVFYREGGTLIIAHRQDTADFNRFLASVQANIPDSSNQMPLLNQQQIAELEPELGERFQQAAYAPNEAWLCTCCVMPALANTLLEQQVPWYGSTNVLSVDPGEIVVKARTGSRSHQFDWTIDCRGLGAKSQLPQLRGVRGEILWIRAPEVKINRLVRLMHPRYRIYIIPRRDDLYLIGATQIESEDKGPVTVRSSLELLSAAYSVHPGFGEAQIVHSDVNLRPAFPNNQPQVLVESTSTEQGLIRVNGLFRHGYLMSPAIAQEVAAYIAADGDYQSTFSHLFQHQNSSEVTA